MSASEINRLAKLILKEWHTRLFTSFQIVFNNITNDFSIFKPKQHGFVVGNASAHVPTESQHFVFDFLYLNFVALN